MEVRLSTQEKQISAQMFVMNNLRNGIDYLKEHCHKDQTNGRTLSEGFRGFSECFVPKYYCFSLVEVTTL